MERSPWENMEIPTPKWTPINDPETSTPTSDLASEARSTLASPKVLNADTSFTGLTDDEILAGGLDLLKGTNLLQVACTHTNKEILAKINENHALPILSDKTLSNKLAYVLNHQSKLQKRPRQELANELEKARTENGVIKRVQVQMTEGSVATRRANKAKRLEQHAKSTETKKEKEDLVGPPNLVKDENNDNNVEEKRELRHGCENLVKEGERLLYDDRLFYVAGVLATHEIVEISNATTGNRKTMSSAILSQRLNKAIQYCAERDGKSKEALRSELDATRRSNGVFERVKKDTHDRRAAGQARKKQNKNGGSDRLQDAMDVDREDTEESEEEDPLGDLEEMGRRVLEGSLLDYDTDAEEFPSRRPLPPKINIINRREVLPIVVNGFFRAYPAPDQLTQPMTDGSMIAEEQDKTMGETEETVDVEME